MRTAVGGPPQLESQRRRACEGEGGEVVVELREPLLTTRGFHWINELPFDP